MSTTTFRVSSPKPTRFDRLEPGEEWVHRRAKLFEAGDFPDKGLVVTPNDLERMASGFAQPIPVLIEHADSPFEIGLLTEVEAIDGELFGTVSLTPEANAMVERSEARSLSVGLAPDLSEIREVSLVRHPRIADAQLFGGLVRMCGEFSSSGVAEHWRSKYESLLAERRSGEARAKVAALLKEGKICPAQASAAEALLSTSTEVRFAGASQPVSSLVEQFLRCQPSLALFGECAAANLEESASSLLLPEEADFYRRYFPEVSLDAIAAKR